MSDSGVDGQPAAKLARRETTASSTSGSWTSTSGSASGTSADVSDSQLLAPPAAARRELSAAASAGTLAPTTPQAVTPTPPAGLDAEGLPLRYATESWTGHKETNEDRYVENAFCGGLGRFFGIFDGHAGTSCADYVVKCLCNNIMGGFYYSESQEDQEMRRNAEEQRRHLKEVVQTLASIDLLLAATPDDEGLQSSRNMLLASKEQLRAEVQQAVGPSLAYQAAALKSVKDGFQCTDKNYINSAKQKKETGGSTAIVAILGGSSPTDAHLIIANLGDCRAVLCRGRTAVPLSEDHKPNRPDEEKRIKGCGGRVVNVMGVSRATLEQRDWRSGEPPMLLAVSRCFGDYPLKLPKPVISSVPEVRIEPLQDDDAFLILACDGIWDVLSSQEAVNIAIKHWNQPREAAAAIVRKAYQKGSQDNLTAMMIQFGWQTELNFDDASSDDTAERAEGTAGAAVVSDPDEVLVVKEADQDIFGGD